jgi:cytochrome c553
MGNHRSTAPRDPRFAVWIGTTVVLFVAALLVGFVWLPSAQRGPGEVDWWDTICRAAGFPTDSSARAAAPVAGHIASTVAWTPATRQRLREGDAARGAAIADTCNNCHGANGVSADAIIPNLAGQGAAAIYKQLEDYKSGKRDAAVMGVFVSPLSQQQVIDVAAHYASSLAGAPQGTAATPDEATRRLIQDGDPMRGIVACAACHGPQGHTTAAPPLLGQQRAYLETQLLAFKAGQRHNDISEQMRSVARALSAAQIAALAAYYASQTAAGGQ